MIPIKEEDSPFLWRRIGKAKALPYVKFSVAIRIKVAFL